MRGGLTQALSRVIRIRAVELLAPAVCSAVALALRLSGRRAGLVVLFHLVGERQGDPRRELVSPLRRDHYERQLSHLRRRYDVVPLEKLQAAVAARRRGVRYPVSITLDDDESRHATHALPGLLAEDLPATFYLCGSFFDPGDEGFWWHHLQRAVDAGMEPPGDLFRVAFRIARLDPPARRLVAERLAALAGPPPTDQAMSRAQAAALVEAGRSIGFHTRHHYALPELDDAQLADALTEGRAELERLAGRPLTTLSYPHGDADERVTRAAREHGFTLGVTCRRTAVTPDTDPMLLGRVEIKGASLGEFAVQVVRGLLSPA